MDRSLLIVEDDASMSTMLSLFLEDAGYNVQIAQHGVEALEMLQTYRPALILLDIRMPVMDGPEFLQQARQQFPDHLPPIILMTAYRDGGPEIRQLGLPWITKPMQLDELLQLVRQHIPPE